MRRSFCRARRDVLLVAFVVAGSLLEGGCYVPPPVPEVPSWLDAARTGQTPSAEEEGLAREADESLARVVEEDGLVENDSFDRYLTGIVARLIPELPAAAPTLTPRVYAAVERNAFALPNGAILVTAGLLVELENEAQLAFLLGHEAAHVLLRHQLLDERFGAETDSHVDRMWLSRHLEDEADELGFALVTSAGYAPDEAARMLRHVRDDRPPAWARVTSWDSHFEAEVRIRAMRVRARRLVREGRAGDVVRRETFLEAQDGVRLAVAELTLEAGHADRARELVDRHLTRHPDSARAYWLRAEITRAVDAAGRRAPTVRSDYERAIELAPADADAHRALGLLLRDLREPDAARPHLERYLELRPEAVDRRLIERYLAPRDASP